jgi:hypothetical protein
MMQPTDWVEDTWARRWWYRSVAVFISVVIALVALRTGAWASVPLVLTTAALAWLYPSIMVDARDLGRTQGAPEEHGFMVVPETCPLCSRFLTVDCSVHGAVVES